MNENIESVKKYNLWFGNTIDCGFPRPLYTESVASYLGSKVVKVLTGQRRVGKVIYCVKLPCILCNRGSAAIILSLSTEN